MSTQAGGEVKQKPVAKVRPSAKLIANGRNGTTLKAVLQLLPVVSVDVEENTVDLRDWPTWVFTALGPGTGTLQAKLVMSGAPGTTFNCMVSAPRLATAFADDTSADAVAKLWQHSFEVHQGEPNESSDPWGLLCDALKASSQGGKWSVEPAEYSQSPSGDANDPQVVQHILVNKQRDQSLAFEVKRALEVCETLSGQRIEQAQATALQCQPGAPKNVSPVPDAQDTPNKTGQELLREARKAEMAALEASWAKAAHQVTHEAYKSAKDALKEGGDLQPICARVDAQIPGLLRETSSSAVDKTADTHLQGHAYTTANESFLDRDPPPDAIREAVQRRFFNISSTPTLARLFGLAADVEITVKGNAFPQNGTYEIWLDSDLFDARSGTLARLDGAHFWPAVRGGAPDQSNGVMLTGANCTDGTGRFDVSCLDLPYASEKALEKLRRLKAAAGSVDMCDASTARPHLERYAARDTLATAGFSLFDTARQFAIAQRLAARSYQTEHAQNGTLVFDANDLMVGLVPDVGVPESRNGKAATRWHTLMSRDIKIDIAENALRVLNHLCGAELSPERRQLDLACIAPSLNLRPVPADVFEEKKVPRREAIADQLLLRWDGGPMGVNCAGSDDLKTDSEDLPVSRTYSLPTVGTAEMPPKLRFGRAYRFGIRCMYQGGVSVPLSEAQRLYDDPEKKAALPGWDSMAPAKSFRRFLRHERIGIPHLLLPQDEALGAAYSMGFRNTNLAVVRSFVNEAGKTVADPRAEPDSTLRYIMPPGVSQDFAALHGAFDDQTGAVKVKSRLPDGIAYNPANGGFPQAFNVTHTGLNGDSFIVKREIRLNAQGPGEAIFSLDRKVQAQLTKDLEAENKAAKAAREDFKVRPHTLYHPDPLATTYVIGVRHASSTGYAVPPTSIEAYDGTTLLPLRLEVKRRGPDEALLSTRKGSAQAAGQTLAVWHVTIALDMGEDMEVDVWCAPSELDLARHFAVVEMLGALTLQAAATDSQKSDILCKLTACTAPPGQTERPGQLTGPAGVEVPGKDGLGAVARLLREQLLARPVDEIAAVQTFRAVHATNRPQHIPAFMGMEKCETVDLAIRRYTRQRIDVLSAKPAGERREMLAKTLMEEESATSEPFDDDGAHDHVVFGTIKLDTATSHSFRIHAKTVFPRTTVFDSALRSRGKSNVLAGRWLLEDHFMPDGQADSGKEFDSAPGRVESRLVPPAAIYGFHVKKDKSVILPATQVTLMSVSNLPRTSAGEAAASGCDSSLTKIALEAVYGIADKTGNYPPLPGLPTGVKVPKELAGASVKIEHAFPDGKARKLEIWIESISRHAALMTRPSREKRDGEPELLGTVYPSEPLADDEDSLDSGHLQDIWIPATIRPLKPEAETPRPSFAWSTPDLSKSCKPPVLWRGALHRTCTVHIPLKRGWFSSGQGERLGIVIWPPNLFTSGVDARPGGHGEIIENSNVLLKGDWLSSTNDPAKGDRLVALDGFEDRDLGPGGAFVSRWGGDPIRKSTYDIIGMFIPPQQFTDMQNPQQPANGATYHVADMPVATFEDEGSKPGRRTQYLTVGLLTYEPRFELDSESWFVDVPIALSDAPDPLMRLGLVRFQEHAPRRLRVSEPALQNTQLLPARVFEVAVEMKPNAGPTLKLSLTGIASEDAAVDGTPVPANAAPIIRYSLWRSSETVTGPHAEELLEGSISKDAGHSVNDGQTTWQKSIPLDADMFKEAGTYFIHAHEVDRRQRSTLPNEPVAIPTSEKAETADQNYTDSGERFMGRIDLPDEVVSALAMAPAVE